MDSTFLLDWYRLVLLTSASRLGSGGCGSEGWNKQRNRQREIQVEANRSMRREALRKRLENKGDRVKSQTRIDAFQLIFLQPHHCLLCIRCSLHRTKARLKRPEVLLLESFFKILLGIPIVYDVTTQMQHLDADGQVKVEKNVNLRLAR